MAQTKEGALIISAKKRGITVAEYKRKTKTHKWCLKGKHWQKKSLFCSDRTRHDGLSYRCKECIKSKHPWASLKGRISTFKGRHHTEAAKKLLSEQKKGSKSPMEGKRHTLEVRIKISKILRERMPKGRNCRLYKGGKNKNPRNSKEHKRWRYDVLARDKFICQKCGGTANTAHHIKPFSKFPELRFDINNGSSRCKECHKKDHAKKHKHH